MELLPTSHQIYLRHVICVLHRISVHADTNNMTARNLSVCVAQNLLWPPRRIGAAEMLVDVSKVSQICQLLIESASDVFGPQCLELFGVATPSVPEAISRMFNISTDDESQPSMSFEKFGKWTNSIDINQSITHSKQIYIVPYVASESEARDGRN